VRAAAAYAARLDELGVIDTAQLAGHGRELAQRAAVDWPRHVVLAGFDRPTPSFAALLDAVRARGVRIDEAPEPAFAGSGSAAAYRDGEALWRAAGQWARRCLEANPEARVAIVVPDLERDAVRIGRLVREGFAPGWQLAGSGWQESVNVSYGQRLSEYPAVATALALPRLAAGGLPAAEVSVLLRSPFIAAGDAGGRARLELALRERPDRRWTPAALAEVFDAPRVGSAAQAWLRLLATLDGLDARAAERRAPEAWARELSALLDEAGWPGSESPDSDAWQLLNRWRALLNQFTRLGRVRPSLDLSQALQTVARLAGETLWQPESGAAAVSVLGLLETAGLEFDDLWIGGMDASRWPPAGSPLALVNRELQRETGMPDATPADTLEFARSSLERLERSAPRYRLAWAVREGETELEPSPLLGTAGETAGDAPDPGWFAAGLGSDGALVDVARDPAPPVADGEKIRGGAYTLQRMREEPFTAFAAGRLAAEPLEPFVPGLPPRLRGTLVHDALRRIFAERPSQRQIAGWPDRVARIDRAVRLACRPLLRQADPVLAQVLAIESRRLGQLLDAFIELELARGPFEIRELERPLELRRGPVCLGFRVDRIDRLQDGGLLLADYKTGSGKRFLGLEREPKSVQLPAYACAVDESVAALAYFNVDSRDLGYDGAGGEFSSGRTRIPDEDWDAELARWTSEVESLVQRLARGEIGVSVRQAADKARPYALLSRVAELRHDH